MIILLSPAKSLQDTPTLSLKTTQIRLKKETAEIAQRLGELPLHELKKLMKLSDTLASLNYGRYQDFSSKFTKKNALPAGFTFSGAVFQGLDLASLSKDQIIFAQAHLRILSGLYGALRPLDLIQPYRLEMGTKLQLAEHKNLYSFWGDKITKLINKDLKEVNANTIINLASKEYFKSIIPSQLNGRLLTIDFREERDGKFKFITFNAKKARGLMTRYILQNKIQNPEELKYFLGDNYTFNVNLSKNDHWVFTR